ncbi:MAG: ribosome assembly RNA-binding protein YhbY [Gammaproteobacteria bacterium]
MNPVERRKLRAQAHTLKPVILIGQSGLTDAVLAEIELALDSHELIKIRIRSDDREIRKHLGEKICQLTGADLIQTIGQIAVIFRSNPDK